MKKYLLIIITVLIISSVINACASGKSGAPPRGKSDAKSSGMVLTNKTIGLSLSSLNNPILVSLKRGAEDKAKEMGFTLIVTDANDNSEKQKDDINELIAKKVAALLINPTDSVALKSAIVSANKAKIPVLTLDRRVRGGKITSHISSDNITGGEIAGKYMIQLLGQKAKIVVLEGIPESSASQDRGKGFKKAIKKKLVLLDKETAHFNRDEGQRITEQLLEKYKDIEGIFAQNDEMALGAMQAIQAAGKTLIKIIGFDATDEAIQAIKAGRLSATIAQQPALIGSISIETAISILHGRSVKKEISVPLSLVKK